MFRPVGFALVTSLAAVAFAQSSTQPNSSRSASSPVQVVYYVDGSTLTTYNVNAQTLEPAQAGAITLPESVYPGIETSRDGRFIYYTAFENYSQQGSELWVYPTNASGVPQNSPIQTLNFTNLYSPLPDPTAPFLYALYIGPAGTDSTPYEIVRYSRNPKTGQLSDPVTEATYNLSYSVGGETCSLGILGYNPLGSELYDEVSCTAPYGSSSATYNERTVNAQNGALGPDQQIFSWTNSNGGGERVQFVRNLLFDYVSPDPSILESNYVDVYPVQPNTSTPLIQCTSSMQAVCGSYQLALAHPSARYVFMFDQNNLTEIDQANLSAKQFTATSSSIPYEVQQFSPDGRIAYGVNDVNGALDIEIYGFNASNAATTEGGSIQVPSDLDSWWAAERY